MACILRYYQRFSANISTGPVLLSYFRSFTNYTDANVDNRCLCFLCWVILHYPACLHEKDYQKRSKLFLAGLSVIYEDVHVQDKISIVY